MSNRSNKQNITKQNTPSVKMAYAVIVFDGINETIHTFNTAELQKTFYDKVKLGLYVDEGSLLD